MLAGRSRREISSGLERLTLAVCIVALSGVISPYVSLGKSRTGPGGIASAKAIGKKQTVTEAVPINERFSTLAEYLAWAKSKRFIDIPWYEEIKPGLYKYHHGRGPRPDKTTFTESELKVKFGFAR